MHIGSVKLSTLVVIVSGLGVLCVLCCGIGISVMAAIEVTRSPADKTATALVRRPGVVSQVNGRGQTATAPLQLADGNSRVKLTHVGTGNFIVKAFVGSKETLLVNAFGNYDGARWLEGTGTATFDIMADGAWTVQVELLGIGGEPVFSGKGADVSRTFKPPANGAWEISHDGTRSFVVWLRCANSTTLLQNGVGVMTGSRIVQFGRGPCFWDVQADGNWSLAPR